MRQRRTSSPVRGTRECPGVPKRAQSVRPATVSATVYHWAIGEAQRFHRSQAPPPAFFSALPEELVLRVFSFLSVTELENMCVNRKFLRLFHEPALWKARVQALLPSCTLGTRLAVEKSLCDDCHLWSAQLRYDNAWLSRLALLPSSDALAFEKYARERAYENTYKLMAQFEMVSMRHKSSGMKKLATIPFTQRIKDTRTGESSNLFRVSLVPGKQFMALCTWKYGLYDMILNGTKMKTFCFLRVGDVVKMVRKKSGKTREFSMQLLSRVCFPAHLAVEEGKDNVPGRVKYLLRKMIQTSDLETLTARLCKEHVWEQFGAKGEAVLSAHKQLIKDTIDKEVQRREHRSFSAASGGR
jgi:hypothetical protein